MTRSKIPKKRGSVKPGKGSNSAKSKGKTRKIASAKEQSSENRASAAAKKGWEMRRRKAQIKLEARKNFKKNIKATIDAGKKRLKKDKKTYAGMSRHTDAEGFVIITDPGRKLTKREAAVKGWQTRRTKVYQASGISYFGSRDWAELSSDRADALSQLAEDVFSYNWISLEKEERVNFVRAGLMTKDKRFVAFMTLAREMGYTIRQARTALFSPRAIPLG